MPNLQSIVGIGPGPGSTGTPVPGVSTGPSGPGTSTGALGLQDWQAAIAAYVVLYILADSDGDTASLAAIFAWGITVGYITWVVSKAGGIHNLIPAIGGPGPDAAPTLPSSAGPLGQSITGQQTASPNTIP